VAAAASTGNLGRDDRFWKNFAYAFQLHVAGSTTVFPLVINPEIYRKTHPFAVDLTPTQEGGIYLEEQGIVISEITLEGNTGFKPQANPGETGAPPPALPLSGQAHFLRLQNLCFRRYSELKKDPEQAADVYMTWHNFKDNEHWIVAPVEFELNRQAKGPGRTLYPYRIRLKALGEVTELPAEPGEDETVISAISDAIGSIVTGQSRIEGGLVDVGDVSPTLNNLISVQGAVTAVNAELTSIIGATREFTRRVKRTIALPFSAIQQAKQNVFQLQDALRDIPNLPLDIIQTYQDIEDALDTIGTYPEAFFAPYAEQAEAFLRLTQGPGTSTADDLEAAAATNLTQTADFRNSALRPGDLIRVVGGVFQRTRTFPRYEGYREVIIIFYDTLQTIAARELGDARRWIDIAIANDLRAPYISDEGLPGTKRYGDPILIPTESRGGSDGSIRSAGNADLRGSQDEATYGRDLELEFDGNGRADLKVDTALGSTDMRTVVGVPNLQQAVNVILSTEQGTNLLYLQVGFPRIVGQRGTLERVLNAQLAVAEAIQRDPRIERTRGVDFSADLDALTVEIDAVIIDNNQARVIGRILS